MARKEGEARDSAASPESDTKALDGRLRKLGDYLLSLHEILREHQDALAQARHYQRDLAREDAPFTADLQEALEEADDTSLLLGEFLGNSMAALMGAPPYRPLPQLAGELAAVVEELGGREATWLGHADDVRRHWRAND